MAEIIAWRGKQYKLHRRGSRTYRASEVTLRYNPPNKKAIEKYRAKGTSFWDGPGAVGELDGVKLVLDGNHRFAAGLTMSCERYVGERI